MGEFEKDMDKLEDIARQLQTGELGIEKSMALYDEGTKLAEQLKKKLDTYQQKIDILGGEVTEK